MGLQETLEEQKKELEEALDKESEAHPEAEEETLILIDEPIVEEVEETTEDSTDESDESAEEPTDEAKEEVKEEEPEMDVSGYARLRRELAAQKKLTADAEDKALNPITEEVDQSQAQNNEVEDMLQERRLQKASGEFSALESEFSSNVPDFEDVSIAYKTALYQSIRVQNPRKSHVELLEETRNTLLHKASNYMNKGLDPIQEMYEEAKSLGFKALPKQEHQAQEEEIKPDLNKIAKNKSKNAGMVATQGGGAGATLTREAANELTSGEWAKLSASEKARILGGG